LQSVGAGTFHALIIETELFQALSSERGLPHSRAQSLKVHEKLSQALASRATELLRFARSGATEMQAQSGVIGLFEMVVEELIDQPLPARVTKDLPLRAAEKIRECLHSDEGGALNLDQLAERVGMSRFQVLRAFRARYGLPPYAYQLCARVARARKLLSSGRAPAEVSAKCGFADQSHFGRHFKRLVGITPAQYARASNGAAHLRPNEFGLWDVVGAPDSRKAPAQGRP
jgi:AraC-like DNA-binding protein